MADDVIISVEHLSKRYKLGQIGATSLRESAERWWHRLRGRDPDEHMGRVGEQKGPRVSKGSSLTSLSSVQDSGDSEQKATKETKEQSKDGDLWALKFDEIVAFSEVEKFIDAPVKRYSSGLSRRSVRAKTDMYVRLAFAVAAHLDPEILRSTGMLKPGDVGRCGDVCLQSGRCCCEV